MKKSVLFIIVVLFIVGCSSKNQHTEAEAPHTDSIQTITNEELNSKAEAVYNEIDSLENELNKLVNQ
jgi:uncharacterized protein YcfL